jgi:LacI family gluconate utilization system Gnt-I transcriptional repressor
MLGQSGYTESREDVLLEAIIGRRPDGIVLTGIMHSPEGRRRLLASGIPVVETWDLTPTPIDMLVGFSHAQAAAAVARHLHAKGRRRVAVLSGDDERAMRRTQGFVEEAIKIGLVHHATEIAVRRVPAPTTLGSGRVGLAQLLEEAPDLDAVMCSSDMLALGVLTEAQARGIAVPERIAVVGFGDLAFARDTCPALSTVRIDGTAIGQRAARFIVDRAEGRDVGEKVVDLGFELIVRASS